MFIGEYIHNLDEKGRLAIPVKFRNKLAGGAVVTKGLDNCLSLYTQESWQKQVEKLESLPQTASKSRAYSRFILAGAFEVETDKQGRVVLPQTLREYANLKGTAIVTGLGDHVEIWDQKTWNSYRENIEKESVDIAEESGI
jgi:MraZ protein